MGDSSVSCALSGITLHGEPVVFIPLTRNSRHLAIEGSRLVTMGIQPCALCSPLTLPYRGELNDCGGFYKGDIEEDLNTALIESAFQMSIHDFTDKCVQGEALIVKGKPVVGIGCFIHEEIYDRFSKPVAGGQHAASVWKARFAGTNHLEAIGCQKVDDLGAGERYRHVYHHPAINGVSFRSDGEFTEVFSDSFPSQAWHGCYGLRDIHLTLLEHGYPGFPKEDISRTKSLSNMRSVYQRELEQIVTRTAYQISQFSPNKKLEDVDVLRTVRFHLTYLSFLDDVNPVLLTEYVRNMMEGRLLDRAEELYYLLEAFTLANRLLMPTITGSQYPQNEITSLIAGFIDKIAKQRVKEK